MPGQQPTVEITRIEDPVRQESVFIEKPPAGDRWYIENGTAYTASDGVEMVATMEDDGQFLVAVVADGYYFANAHVDAPALEDIGDFANEWLPSALMGVVLERLEDMDLDAAREVYPERTRAEKVLSGALAAARVTGYVVRFTWKVGVVLWKVIGGIMAVVEQLVDAFAGTNTQQRRRSRPRFTSNEKDALFRKQKGVCNGCLVSMAKRNLTVDHIVPLAHGGNERLSNLQLWCGFCNSLKGTGTQRELKQKLRQRGILTGRR